MRAPIASSDRLDLCPLDASDVSEAYVRWMNDPEVTRYLAGHGTASAEELRRYVADHAARSDEVFCGIVLRDTGAHVGNIKLGPVDVRQRSASIGVVIGERDRWGQGFATEAIRLLSGHAFGALGLEVLTAGALEGNDASVRAFACAGFVATFDESTRQWRMRLPRPTAGNADLLG